MLKQIIIFKMDGQISLDQQQLEKDLVDHQNQI